MFSACQKVLLLLSLFALCTQVLGQVNTYLVEDQSASATQTTGIEAALTAAGATLTIVPNDAECGPSALMTPVDPVAFPVFVYYGHDGIDWDSCSGAEQTTLTNNINNYVSAGGHFLYTGYDTIANPTQSVWISILGGSSSSDVTTQGPVFGSDPTCDILLNGVGGDLRGAPITYASSDYDSLNGGTAAQCAPDNNPPGTQWSSLAVGSGFITYISDGSFSTTQYSSGGQHDTAIANLIGFVAAVIGGDPHIQGFDGTKRDLKVENGDVVNLLSSKWIQVNGQVKRAPLRSDILYLHQIGVSFKNSNLHLLIDSANTDLENNAAEPYVGLVYNSTTAEPFSGSSRLQILTKEKTENYLESVNLSKGGEIVLPGVEKEELCKLRTLTPENEEFDQFAIPNSPFRQSPVIRTNLRCYGFDITFEVHEFQHPTRKVEQEDSLLWVEYSNGRLLIPVQSKLVNSKMNVWIERRIDMYIHEIEGRHLDEMSGVLGLTHSRSTHNDHDFNDEMREEFVVQSKHIFGQDFQGNLFH